MVSERGYLAMATRLSALTAEAARLREMLAHACQETPMVRAELTYTPNGGVHVVVTCSSEEAEQDAARMLSTQLALLGFRRTGEEE